MATTRRKFILGTLGVTGALVIGWSLMPPRQRLTTSRPLPTSEGEVAFNGWVRIARDGTVTVTLAKSEMGQGVVTSLCMLLAEELDADWSRVRWQQSPIDRIYNNIASVVDGLPVHPDTDHPGIDTLKWLTAKAMREIGVMMTGGSSSVKDLWMPMRQAGASAREMLVAAAAAQWGLAPADCQTENGEVIAPDGRRLGYGALAAAAAQQPLPRDPALKEPGRFKRIGQPTRRLDTPGKIDGSARFGVDALPQGLLYASVRLCPTLGGRAQRHDDAPARALRGVKAVTAVEPLRGGTGGVAVIADHPWRARQAADRLDVTWDHGALAEFSSAAAMQRLADAARSERGYAFYETGEVDAALAGAAKRIDAEYRAPWLAHAAMEPINCTVLFEGNKATVWASTQVPGLARAAAAEALGLPDEAVTVHVLMLGGGFGRRLETDFIAQAAAIAKAVPGQAVQTMWSREQDTRHDLYRPACVARFEAGFDADQRLVAWKNTSAGQAIVPQVLKRAFGLPGGGPDKTTSEGAFDQAYEWPAARIAHAAVELPLQVGFWRSVGHSHQAFFKEGFVDECAHAAGVDPLAFRESLLRQHPKQLAVLQAAAKAANWGTPSPPAPDGARTARGIALHDSFGSSVAQVAEVSLGPDKAIRVHRVWCAIDCGFAVNPAGIRQQLEGGVVFGLSSALHGGVDIVDGQVQQSNFHDQPILRLNESPRVECVILPGNGHPEGVGEPGVPPIAPAVANALFALTGQRLRSLPLKLA
ncbi:MAG: molybdopterin-dependent oxidoreductase [Hydrogenophaga sp.]|uniref:xanthine dehydrogenase family protein molybdopterin-binding subunit n=1 Tax=Hydrogenophaga sp. TaxID=1904254 RepID=UPI0016928BF6|nr:molybdopterin cofactor-binding domain-containing protein [Hydrogenophaga sp.]NIM40491.1 molybdopterin-dependent oxidoreductase [Hydrogenophaga sp.]NIN25909.1 molybdopterin-dependent oxidoreductase [Hydrogenophaga sp.]NIN30781.1 molybdopterin-dependent oxidoreductase [Hydrogenophaga sp.]NIN54874.1 molybdopterin-dependent oxidoreductase [Hydrogenophaga sp.]NIO50914.1 molybdopterin-dependent oxidoreductase [Hydrogenophaga sp.]